jgi:hypothetical protein
MDYRQPVTFGVFLTPDATQPSRTLELAILADELNFELIGVQDHPYQRRGVEDPEALRWFSTDVGPAVREAVAKAR